MSKVIKALTIQDFSCFGQCSITVFLPIVSAFSVEVVSLPTGIYSTHTAAYPNWKSLDLTDQMAVITNHWNENNLKFPLIHTGFMTSNQQFQNTLDTIKKCRSEETFLLIDPILGDNGSLYKSMEPVMIDNMRKIVSMADCITPNLTEACLITNTPYSDSVDMDDILNKLSALGPKHIILKSIRKDGEIGNLHYDCLTKEKHYSFAKFHEGFWHGCGDVLSSILAGFICKGKSINEAIDFATSFISESISITPSEHFYGICFEQLIHKISEVK